MLYVGTLWWTSDEQKLLDVKFDEGEPVDRWVICQATTSFRGKPRGVCYPEVPTHMDVQSIVCNTSNVKGAGVPANRRRNAIQRDATLALVEDVLKPDDVFVFCDLDEIIHGEDWPLLAESARSHGLVYAVMRRYYGKINLQAPAPWGSVFAASGEFLREKECSVDALRKRHKKRGDPRVHINGQHFGWLYPSSDYEGIIKKSRNCSYEQVQNKVVKNIKGDNAPGGASLKRVPVDSSYPRMMLADLDHWREYMA